MLAPLLELGIEWEAQHIFFKGFLPLDVQPFLELRFPQLLTRAHLTRLEWTPELLAEVIRQRVYVASEGAFESLDALASPALRNIEDTLAEVVIPLPREILVLTQRVLWEHIYRKGVDGKIEPEDVDAAIRWYRENQPAVTAQLPL